MNTATKYIIRATFHLESGERILFIKEGDFGKLSEVDRLGDAAFYSTADDAQVRAKRYAKQILEHGNGVKATLDVMFVKPAETPFSISV